MADVKISALPAAGSLVDTMEIPVNNSGATEKVTVSQFFQGTSNKLARYNNLGTLTSANSWTIDPTHEGLQGYITYDVPVDGGGPVSTRINYYEVEIDPVQATVFDQPTAFAVDMHFDRTGSGFDHDGTINGFVSTIAHEGNGFVEQFLASWTNFALGTGTNTGSVEFANADAKNINVGAGFSVTDSLYISNRSVQFNATSSVQNVFHLYNVQGPVVGNIEGPNQNYDITAGGYWKGYVISTSSGTTADSGAAIQIGLQGTFANGVDGIQIDVSNATATSGAKRAIYANGNMEISGFGRVGAPFTAANGQLFENQNSYGVNFVVPNGTAITTSQYILNNFACTFNTGDSGSSIDIGPVGIGQSGVGFVGNIDGDGTAEAINFCLGGYSAGSGTGSADEIRVFASLALPSSGFDIQKNFLYYADYPAGSVASVQDYGFYIKPDGTTSVQNFIGSCLIIGDTDTVTNTSVALEINSTTRVFKLPSLTTTEEGALTAVNGMLLYNSSTHKFRGYANGSWVDLH